MYKFKPLEWCKHGQIDGILAEPYGIRWKYAITHLDNGQIEFAILDEDYGYTTGFPEFYNSIPEAKEKAMQHYLSFLTQLVQW